MFNRRLLSLVLAAGLILGLASLAMAGVPDPGKSEVSTAGGAVTITPAGNGQSLLSRGAGIDVTVRDANGLPIPTYPGQDIWVDDAGSGDINLCQGGSAADADTDANGFTTITGIISGGGNTQAGMSVYVSGVALTLTVDGVDTVIDLDVNSPDINGDRVVDLSDISIFSGDLAPPATAFRSDFNHSGNVDLSDISLFSGWIGEVCP